MTAVLVMCNAWKTPEEQNRHCTAFLRGEYEARRRKPPKPLADLSEANPAVVRKLFPLGN